MVVIVMVERNNFVLEIIFFIVSERILEIQDLGVIIVIVIVRDRDIQLFYNVIRFQMFVLMLVLDYFGIDSQIGNIFVKRDLILDNLNRYLVNLQLCLYSLVILRCFIIF